MTADVGLVAEMRGEILAGLSARERADQVGGGAALGHADEQALGRQMISEAIEHRARRSIREGTSVLSPGDEDELARSVFDALFRMDRLQRLLDDPEIENINANGFDVVNADPKRERVPFENGSTLVV
jgi:hypothetical protein